ncbi:MAG: hypothetical protein OXF77_04835 [Thaumarchaeota archaeon]|nr:hypothetical protein [Nitrososphaerota archaeon]
MSSKNDVVFRKESLLNTKPGKKIIKNRLFKTKGYEQFIKYQNQSAKEFPKFTIKFTNDLFNLIKQDVNIYDTQKQFSDSYGTEFMLGKSLIDSIRIKFENIEILRDRTSRILNSNFIKMTMPIFMALYDSASKFYGDDNLELRENLIYGHLVAIDLSEPMDRITDKDEDLDYLEDYKFLNPYILRLANYMISKCGKIVFDEFNHGFKEAIKGQKVDHELKSKNAAINEENMNNCYQKYRAVIGTAGKNMALCRFPLGEIFYLGMAKAAECTGCGNEIEDAINNKSLKTPSWPLYFYSLTNDIQKCFDLTLKKSEIYMEEARIAIELLPKNFPYSEFLEFLFLTVEHYNHFWYNQLKKENLNEFVIPK